MRTPGNRPRTLLLLGLAALTGCTAADERDDARFDETMLAGGWARPVRAAPDSVPAWEGFRLRPDGTFDLVGIHTMNGVSWELDGDTLELVTNTSRYPEPIPSRLYIERADTTALELRSEANYLAGFFERRELGRWIGTASLESDVVPPEGARLFLELRERYEPRGPEDPGDGLVEIRIVPASGPGPIPFEIDFLPERLKPGSEYYVLGRAFWDGAVRLHGRSAEREYGGDEWEPASELVLFAVE